MNKTLAILFAAFALAPAAQADGLDHNTARRLLEAGAIVSLESIVAAARLHQPGELLEAELEREDGGYEYEIEILSPEGIVYELRFDATDGTLLRREED